MSDFDSELNAMKVIGETLSPLDDEVRGRVMQWALSRFPTDLKVVDAQQELPDNEVQSVSTAASYDTFAEMLVASTADSRPENALMAAYWTQVIQGNETWKTFQVSKLLIDTGNGDLNLSRALEALIKTRPQQLVQTGRPNTSKGKGNKSFKLTFAGINAAKQLLGIN